MWAGMEPGFEPGGVKHEPKKFQVTWSIEKKKNHGRQNNCTLLPQIFKSIKKEII